MPRPYTIPIPRNSLEAFQSRNANTPQNPGLLFDRFAPDWRLDPTLKKDGLEVVANATQKPDYDLFNSWVSRWKEGAGSVGAKPFTRVSDWRFAAGLGRKGSLETGFTFNRYGFPYLPGSSVKGLARIAALVNVAEELVTNKLNELDDILSQDTDEAFKKAWENTFGHIPVPGLVETFRLVFGTTAQTGCAVFLEAIPESAPHLELDIMNPHYPDYYQGKEPPTNWQSPKPIYFLTVAARTPFLFAAGWRRGAKIEADAFKKAKEWLDEGLQNLGAGSKTSAGYGYFSKPFVPPPPGYLRGKVLSFGEGPNKSFGYIQPEGGGNALFVHRNNLTQGLTNLEPGQVVIFKRVKVPQKDDQAQDVKFDQD